MSRFHGRAREWIADMEETGSMILIPCWLLAVFPPGILFPQMSARGRTGLQHKNGDRSDTEKQPRPQVQESQRGAAEAAGADKSGEAVAAEEPAPIAAAAQPNEKS